MSRSFSESVKPTAACRPFQPNEHLGCVCERLRYAALGIRCNENQQAARTVPDSDGVVPPAFAAHHGRRGRCMFTIGHQQNRDGNCAGAYDKRPVSSSIYRESIEELVQRFQRRPLRTTRILASRSRAMEFKISHPRFHKISTHHFLLDMQR